MENYDMADWTINLNDTGPTPSPLEVSSGDNVTFHNAMSGATSISFSSPSPFSPPPRDAQTIAAGGDLGPFNCNSSGGTYEYTVLSHAKGTRSGTIEV